MVLTNVKLSFLNFFILPKQSGKKTFFQTLKGPLFLTG